LYPTEELLNELREMSKQLESSSPEEILQWAVQRFGEKFTMATAFGPEGMVILEMLSRLSPATYVFNLDTGYQFDETLQLRETVKQKYGIEVDLLKPELSVREYDSSTKGHSTYRILTNAVWIGKSPCSSERPWESMHGRAPFDAIKVQTERSHPSSDGIKNFIWSR